jgi:hypothetical protein
MQGQGSFARATETTKYLRGVIPSECGQLSTAIICGSGLGGLSDAVHSSPRFEVSYKDIPHFPQSTGIGGTWLLFRPPINICSAWTCRKASVWPTRRRAAVCGFDGRESTVSRAFNLKKSRKSNLILQFLRGPLNSRCHISHTSIETTRGQHADM